MTTPTTTTPTGSQTLSRGIRILEILAEADRNLTIAEIADGMGVHRSVAYRLLRTLEDHDLVTRDNAGRVTLGAGLVALSSGVSRDLQQAALPVLNDVANDLGMTCLIAVLMESGEVVTLASAAPRQSVAVSYHPGHRHPISRGGPGKAILIGLPESLWPTGLDDGLRAEIALSRSRGYASSHDEVVPSLRSVAVPLTLHGQPPASLAVIHVALSGSEPEIAERLKRAADAVARAFGA